jgi:hypothetical protein
MKAPEFTTAITNLVLPKQRFLWPKSCQERCLGMNSLFSENLPTPLRLMSPMVFELLNSNSTQPRKLIERPRSPSDDTSQYEKIKNTQLLLSSVKCGNSNTVLEISTTKRTQVIR